jgi:hypothetical protein
MGRNRTPPPAKKAAAPAPAPVAPKPAAPAAHKPAAAAPPAAAPQHASHQQAPPQMHQAPPMGMAAPSAGPGLMGTMAASMAGSMAGHAISRQMFGGSNNEGSNAPVTAQQAQQVPASDPCKVHFESYAKCMENSPSCQWAWDEVAKCRSTHGL